MTGSYSHHSSPALTSPSQWCHSNLCELQHWLIMITIRFETFHTDLTIGAEHWMWARWRVTWKGPISLFGHIIFEKGVSLLILMKLRSFGPCNQSTSKCLLASTKTTCHLIRWATVFWLYCRVQKRKSKQCTGCSFPPALDAKGCEHIYISWKWFRGHTEFSSEVQGHVIPPI